MLLKKKPKIGFFTCVYGILILSYMHLKRLELNGFKSFAHKSEFVFDVPIIAIVGPNGSGKSNVVEAIRFVLGEQSVKSMRGKTGSDLIFKGSKDISKMSRAKVTIVFDNKDRVFEIQQGDSDAINVDFDEVSIGREVFSDGSSVYRINGTEVRMKDVHELIASINIGSSGHHIISQGEADRYLNANGKDRRTLIEEALGLKVYQYRLKESLRKLKKSQENIRETELLRKELAPHLRFLKRQVEKIQKAKELRVTLEEQFKTYLSSEDVLINKLHDTLSQEAKELKHNIDELQAFLSESQSEQEVSFPSQEKLREKQLQLRELQSQKQTKLMESGKIEGMMSVLQTTQKTQEKKQVPYSRIVSFKEEILSEIDGLDLRSVSSLSSFVTNLKAKIAELFEEAPEKEEEVDTTQLKNLKAQHQELEHEVQKLTQQMEDTERGIELLNETLKKEQQDHQDSQRVYYEKLSQHKEFLGKKEVNEARREALTKRISDRDMEYQEALVLLGVPHLDISSPEEERVVSDEEQSQLKRELERNKIRLEDMGGGSGIETIKEFEETSKRDEFLAKEIEDVNKSIESLHEIIDGLKETLNKEFNAGVVKINEQFDRFFKLMFGGGKAQLKELVIKKRSSDEDDEEKEEEYGIDIAVELPRKKVSDLDMLSGGERSLTSIALLFALSQVNPPPFLVLDETDAALDEANSQKYGDMIESLSEFSQLVLVTHNRETMSRAQTLFGVTLGRDDASTMLSLRLEDAEKYAK